MTTAPTQESRPIDVNKLLSDQVANLSFLKSNIWWSKSFKQVCYCLNFFWGPALMWAVANVATFLGLYLMEQRMTDMNSPIDQVIISMLIAMAISCSGILLSLWALTAWLLRLTAYAQCLVLDNEMFDADTLNKALKEVSTKKAYLTKLWLVATVYVFVPGLPLAILISAVVLCQPNILAILDMGMLQIPKWVLITMEALIALLSVACSAYMFVTIPISALSSESAGETATIAMKMCVKKYKPVLTIAIVVSLLNIVISSPQFIFSFTKYESVVSSSILINLLAAVWLGITSIFLWPVSIAPFCRFIRLHLLSE